MQAEDFGDEDDQNEGMDYDETQDLPDEEDDLGKLRLIHNVTCCQG